MAHERRDVTQELDVPSIHGARTEEGFALYVVEGPMAGAVLALERDRLTIGRNQESDFALHDEGVSRVHARFERSTGSVTVLDLASRNGTFVNGERTDGPQGLLDGDQVALGRSLLRFAVQSRSDIRLAQQVYEGSIRDHLTGLFNRRYAEEQLHHATRNVSSGYRSVCMLHVDGLAELNEEAGRGVGDELLRGIATKLHDVFGSDDTIARWNGAEFLVLSYEPEPDALAARLKALVGSVATPSPRGSLSTGATAGATTILPGANPAHILAAAEQALHAARPVGIAQKPGREGRARPSAGYSLNGAGDDVVFRSR